MNDFRFKIAGVQALSPSLRRCGFSLLEVAMAIGIVAFALLAVVALLPIGLSASKSAVNQAQSMQAMNAIAQSIQNAAVTGTTGSPPTSYTYTALAPFDKDASNNPLLTWSVSAIVTGTYTPSLTSTNTFWIGANGRTVASKSDAKYLAAVSITPPKDKVSSGKAYIAIAWPGIALSSQNITWTLVTGSGNPVFPICLPQFPPSKQGHVESIVYFNPN